MCISNDFVDKNSDNFLTLSKQKDFVSLFSFILKKNFPNVGRLNKPSLVESNQFMKSLIINNKSIATSALEKIAPLVYLLFEDKSKF